jgi:DNA-binding MarR family transcriptional regulator
MVQRLSEEEKAAYRALMRMVLAVPRAVTADIMAVCGLGLSDYIALENLSEAPGRQLRMSELAIACGLTLSGITRVMDRLDREGLTMRVRSLGDGRGTVAVLAEAGQDRFDQVYLAYLASIRRHIFDHLDGVELAQFTSSMERVAGSALADIKSRGGRSGGSPAGCAAAVPQKGIN